jgi:hypothetical protein
MSYVSDICCKYFIYMLQWLYIYVASVFQMFHLFQSYVAVSVSCCKCRPSAFVSDEGVRTKPRPLTWGGIGRRRRCEEEAQVAWCRCGRCPHDSLAEEFDAVEVDRRSMRPCGIEPGAGASHLGGVHYYTKFYAHHFEIGLQGGWPGCPPR